MNILEQDINKYISDLLADFRKESTAMVKQNIKNANLYVSGDLYNSIDTKVAENSAALNYTIQLFTSEYARTAEGKFKTIRLASADALIEYIKEKGLHHFKFIPGYKNKIPALDIAARRIAWGMIHGNKARGKYKKAYRGGLIVGPYRKQWNKVRKEIVTVFAQKTADHTFNELVKTLKSGDYIQ